MKRGSMFALLGMIAVAGGCAAPAHYVEQKSDSGIVAVPDNSNTWPFYNMKAAKALIEQHVGPNYEIVNAYQFKTGQTTLNDQQTNTDQTQNKRNPNQTSSATTSTGFATTQDTTEWRIVYKRVAAPLPFMSNPNNQGTPINGVAPAGGFATQGPPPGTVPSVQPAGGVGTGSFR